MLHTWMKTIFNLLLIFALAVFAARARAQDEVPPPMPASQTFTDAQLQQLTGPIALYPDPLIAIMLPAATLPEQIVMADRYVSGGGDPNQINQQPWDPNIQALAHYPDVLKWMDNNLNWTTQLGQAFQDQQQDVMTAIQELRTDAYNLGNLQSTPQQQVINDNGYIEIVPANPDDVYAPQYQPDQVYYQQPIYGSSFIVYGAPYIVGPWLCGDFDWRRRHLIHWDHDHPRPTNWWHQRPEARASYIAAGHAPVWNGANRTAYNRAYQGDRGYNWTAPAANRPAERPGNQNNRDTRNNYNNNLPWTNPGANRPAPAPAEHPNAFIGIDNANNTRNYSDRGEHSMQTMPQFLDLGGFHGNNAPPAAGSFHGGNPPMGSQYHGGAPAGGGGYHGGAPAGGGGGGGRH